jgi:hypothetical protein
MQRLKYWAGRSIYKTRVNDEYNKVKSAFEERVVIVRAKSEAGATQKLHREASQYARFLAGSDKGVQLLPLITIFEVADDELKEGSEVWSVFRKSPLNLRQYLDHFHANEMESFSVFPTTLKRTKIAPPPRKRARK